MGAKFVRISQLSKTAHRASEPTRRATSLCSLLIPSSAICLYMTSMFPSPLTITSFMFHEGVFLRIRPCPSNSWVTKVIHDRTVLKVIFYRTRDTYQSSSMRRYRPRTTIFLKLYFAFPDWTRQHPTTNSGTGYCGPLFSISHYFQAQLATVFLRAR